MVALRAWLNPRGPVHTQAPRLNPARWAISCAKPCPITDVMVVYDLLRAFSALASTQGPLLGGFSHGHHIPQHVAAGHTLQHANVTLLPADFLMKAFEQIRRAYQRDIRPWKMHRQVTQSLLKVLEKGCHRLGLSGLPSVAKHLRPRPNLACHICSVNLARIGQDGPLTFLFGLTIRWPRGLPCLNQPIPVSQVIRNVFDLVEDTALMRHPIQMAVQRLCEPRAPITHDQLGGLFRHPLGVQGPHERTPSWGILISG